MRLRIVRVWLTGSFGFFCRDVGHEWPGIPHPLRTRRPHDCNHVMHDGTRAGPNFRRRHPSIFRESCRDDDVDVLKRAGCRNRVGVRHLEYDVRLYVPALLPLNRSRFASRIAFRRARVNPRNDRVNILFTKTPVVHEMTVPGIREPGRHFASEHGGFDGFRPRTRFRVGEQRHRADFSRPVTGLAVLLEDGKNVFVKSDVLRSRVGSKGRGRYQ